MRSFDPKSLPQPELHALLLSGVSPRPIALVSTVSSEGVNNLAPFSFFNCFGSNPPMVAFGPARRGRDGTLKDTYNNLLATKECVIQAVSHAMVEQVNLASAEFPSSIDEFVKSGLTPIASTQVKPPRVAQSPFQMECVLKQAIPLGEGKGSGNLMLCEVVALHVAEDVWKDGRIDPHALDLVARMGYDYYCRASGESVFEVVKPITKLGVGYDNLPQAMRESEIYSANNLGKFANSERLPQRDEVEAFIKTLEPFEATEEAFFRFERAQDYRSMLGAALYLRDRKHPKAATFIERAAKCALENNDPDFAWKTACLLAG